MRRCLVLLLFCAGPAWSADWTSWWREAKWTEPLRQAQWAPVFDGQMLLGQVFQDSHASFWQGNASASFSPAAKFSDAVMIVPTYAGTYQGSKNVTELAGGAQLFQDSQSHFLGLKEVYRHGDWKLKPSLSYRWELLRETAQEKWGHGLFDYRKPAAGIEAEYAFSPNVKATAALDYYAIDFPNYASLESQASPGLGREQTQVRTLNSRNYSETLGGSFPLPFENGSMRLSLNNTDRYYPEQYLVDVTGRLTPDLRSDNIKSVSGTFYYGGSVLPKLAGLFSFGLTQTRYISNQNHYDPELNVFNSGYYSYEERSLQPGLTAVVGERKTSISFSYLRIERDYLGRMAQDAAGSYLNEATHLTQDSFLLDLTIPLSYGLKFVAHSALTNSASNTLYEKVFRYNYTISSHLLGISYSY